MSSVAFNFRRMCRTCLYVTDAPLEQLQPISESPLGETRHKLTLAELLNEGSPKLKIQMEDELPKRMCSSCVDKLLAIYEFQVMCYSSDKHLRNLLAYNQMEEGFEEEPPTKATGHSDVELEKPIDRPQAIVKAEEDPLESDDDDFIDETKVNAELKDDVGLKLEVESKDDESTGEDDQTTSAAPRDHMCDQCGRVFKNLRGLRIHLSMHTRIKLPTKTKRVYTCKLCEKVFTNSYNLRNHERSHTGERPYLCPECGSAFKTDKEFSQHRLRHANVRRFECPDCPSKFFCPGDLSNHKAQVHTKVRPHACTICGHAFRLPKELKYHMMYHNNDKPFKCEYCDARFICESLVRQHARKHTGEKPYKCKYCIRAFAQHGDLMKHLRLHVGDNVYRCERCPAAFRLASELRGHYASHKNDTEETKQRNLEALREQTEKLAETVTIKRPRAERNSKKKLIEFAVNSN